MKIKKSVISFISITAFIFLNATVYAESIRISQIDSSTLLLNQKIKAYVSITDPEGLPVKEIKVDQFTVFESADGKDYKKIPHIIDFQTMANYESGINFLLLIDNSGSMYLDMNGKLTRVKAAKRISQAKNAVTTFLKSMTNPKDRVGLASYHAYYQSYSDPIADKEKIEQYLNDIPIPKNDEGFTEIYASLYRAVDGFRSIKGRKAIIILSDGENRPYYPFMKKPHKDYGTKIYTYTEPIVYCQQEGISVFAINFGTKKGKKEKRLYDIAIETGGAVFDAQDGEELSKIYAKIVNQILNEYLLTYHATMDPADKKYVKVQYKSDDGEKAATRFYFSSTVFGLPLKSFNPLLIIPFILAFILAWLLSKIKFEKKKRDASLEVFNPGPTKAVTKVLTLNKGKTIIGGTTKADMTIIGGVTKIKDNHATIIFDEKKKQYVIVGDGDFKVNNKTLKTKVLKSGDVINVGGATIVFDDGDV